jgi:hypothetical protein
MKNGFFSLFKKSPTPPGSPSKKELLKEQLPLAEILKKEEFLTEELVKKIVKGSLKVAPYDISSASLDDAPILSLSEMLILLEGKIGKFLCSKNYKHILIRLAQTFEVTSFTSKKLIFDRDLFDYEIMKANCTLGEKRDDLGVFCSEVANRYSNFLFKTESLEEQKLKDLMKEQMKILFPESGLKEKQTRSRDEVEKNIVDQGEKIKKLKEEKKRIMEILLEENITEVDIALTDAYFSFYGSLFGLINIIEYVDDQLKVKPNEFKKETGGSNSPLKKMDSFFVGIAEKIPYSEENFPHVHTFSNGIHALMGHINVLIDKTKNEKEAHDFFVRLASFLDVIDSKRPKLDEKDVRKSRKSHDELKIVAKEIRDFDEKNGLTVKF